MLGGVFRNPTAIHFGKDMELTVGERVAEHGKRVLLVYGGQSLKQHGVHGRIVQSLRDAGVDFVELGGVKPNPTSDLIYDGIESCRQHGLDFVLAAGGGSVIDTAKAIALGVPYGGDFFDFFERKQVPAACLPIGTVLTVPGAGSESSSAAAVTSERSGRKLAVGSPLLFPVFSILNPQLTTTLNRFYTQCGIVDAMSHVFERYFTNTTHVDCTDRICEGLLQTLMKQASLVDEAPDDYDVRAEIMWACKLAHDDTAGFGRKQDWATHAIAHEIGALYDLAHGAILGVIFPAWMRHVQHHDPNRFVQLALRVFGVETDGAEAAQVIEEGILRYQRFLQARGMPITLRELGVVDQTQFGEIAQRCGRLNPSGTIGNYVRLAESDCREILEAAA
jgi:hypothetical protein